MTAYGGTDQGAPARPEQPEQPKEPVEPPTDTQSPTPTVAPSEPHNHASKEESPFTRITHTKPLTPFLNLLKPS